MRTRDAIQSAARTGLLSLFDSRLTGLLHLPVMAMRGGFFALQLPRKSKLRGARPCRVRWPPGGVQQMRLRRAAGRAAEGRPNRRCRISSTRARPRAAGPSHESGTRRRCEQVSSPGRKRHRLATRCLPRHRHSAREMQQLPLPHRRPHQHQCRRVRARQRRHQPGCQRVHARPRLAHRSERRRRVVGVHASEASQAQHDGTRLMTFPCPSRAAIPPRAPPVSCPSGATRRTDSTCATSLGRPRHSGRSQTRSPRRRGSVTPS